MTETKTNKTVYILFTGLPGSGKSSTLREVISILDGKNKKAIFRDTTVVNYGKFAFYTGVLRHVPFSIVFKVGMFWATYFPTKESGYNLFEHRFWNKKTSLCKRLLMSHLLIYIEKPDYFIDETIEAEYRILDLNKNKIRDFLNLFPGARKLFVFVDTEVGVSIERGISRESKKSAEDENLINEWNDKKLWFEDMYQRINQLYFHFQKNSNFETIKLDGRGEVLANAKLIVNQIENYVRD